jgi:hypothetical protein
MCHGKILYPKAPVMSTVLFYFHNILKKGFAMKKKLRYLPLLISAATLIISALAAKCSGLCAAGVVFNIGLFLSLIVNLKINLNNR